ncbi:hypothetical protein Tco_1362397 [Tanacetum coccineum]
MNELSRQEDTAIADGSGIETIVYADSDHAGDTKQTLLAISNNQADNKEYVSAGKACQQALWMKQALIDYGIRLDNIPIMCDNKGAIDLNGESLITIPCDGLAGDETGRTAKLLNDILMFQQCQDKSLYDAWTRFKDLLQKVPHHGLDPCLQVQIFYDHVDYTTQMAIDYVTGERLRKLRLKEAWETIEDLAQHEEEEE